MTRSLNIQVPPLDWNGVHKRIKDFNSSGSPYYWAEIALHEAFKNGLTKETAPLCVLAVNSFWKTNVEKEPGALSNLLNSVAARLAQIQEAIKSIRSYQLPLPEAELASLCRNVCVLLPVFLKSKNGKRTNYSFATKFLHWCCPSSLPIVDNLSARTMNRMLASRAIWVPGPGTSTSEKLCKQSYELVLRFYNQALKQLNAGQRSALEKYDLRTQPEGFARRNTAVRILDKYLWAEQKLATL